MSLKAKLEAVIYAAEEPVTLAQLAALFAADALEWKAEQTRKNERAAEAEATEPLSLIPTGLDYLGLDQANAASAAAEPPSGPAEPAADPASDSTPSTVAEDNSDAIAVGSSSEADQETRRLARLRDREVRAILRELIDELIVSFASDDRGIEIREIAGGYRMATKPECHDAVRSFIKSLKPPLKLSLPALETLAVIAYKQPVTAPEVNEIRGVDSSGVFGSLLARKLIATAGRKQVIGRPILYKTTREFLLRFGLKDVAELPSMEEFEKLAAIDLDETEPSFSEESALSSASTSDLSLGLYETSAEEAEDESLITTPVTPDPSEPAVTAASDEPLPTEEAAPAAPPPKEQAETENSPHGEEDQEDR